jgi:hypothetical protein
MRLTGDLARNSQSRLEGSVHADPSDSPTSFSGILEFLQVLEDFLGPDATSPATPTTNGNRYEQQ